MKRYQPNPEVLASKLPNETVLFHMGNDRLYQLNGTATRVWDLLSSGCGTDEIRDRMSAEFEIDSEQLAREIESLLLSLDAEGLVVAGEGAAA